MMRAFSKLLQDVPREQIEGLAAHITGYLTDDEFPNRSAFLGVPPSKMEILAAIDEWLSTERELH